jgi:hypothetical protein
VNVTLYVRTDPATATAQLGRYLQACAEPTCVIASVSTTPPRVCDDSRACLSHASDAAGAPAIETPSSTDHPRCRRQNGMIAGENGAYRY